MKKVTTFAMATVFIIIMTLTVYAYEGDPWYKNQPIYSTDILVELDGKPIQGYCVDGTMMIDLDDLVDYGFTGSYDDSVRCLFVTKTGKPIRTLTLCPSVERPGRLSVILI